MNNRVLIKIKNKNINDVSNMCINKSINIYKIKKTDKDVLIQIDSLDLEKLQIYYKVEIIKNYSLKSLINKIINNYHIIIMLLFAFALLILFSNIIVEVKIDSSNPKMQELLSKELDKYNIKRLTFKKDYLSILNIKENILDNNKDQLEWLEIENIGMTYNVKLEERKKNNIQVSEGNCNIIAQSDGVISKIISDSGVILVKINQYVKEGDILISGEVLLNDEVKGNTCAMGDVYAEKWYNISLSIPYYFEKKEYSKKKRYNLLLEIDNNDYKIFKSRFKKYDSDKKEIISILGKKLYLIKEYEYKNNSYKLDEESLDKKIDELIFEHLELNLNDKEKIISKNILKKEENNSRINIEVFVAVERLISKQIIYN